MLKRILAGTLLALPLSIASVQTQASAAQIIVRPNRPNNHRPVVVRKVVRQRWVPAHWERTPRGRRWVPGHYQRY